MRHPLKKILLISVSIMTTVVVGISVLKSDTSSIETNERDAKEQIMLQDLSITKRMIHGGTQRRELLDRVSNHQKANLRLHTFPDAKQQYGMRTLDAKSGQEVETNSPEQNQGMSHYVKQEVVVKFRSEPTPAQLQIINEKISSAKMRKLDHTYVFVSKKMTTSQLIDFFRTYGVVYAEPHYVYVTNKQPYTKTEPNDEFYNQYQWNLPMIATLPGWSLTKGDKQMVVGVIDTGVALGHPDLQGRLVDGYNALYPDLPPEDDVGHGTHVSGVISALTDNGQGIAGMTWYNKVMPIKVLDDSGMGSTYSVAEGIIWAVDHGAKVINMSLGNYASAQFLHDAIVYAYNHDVVLIAATGNDNTNQQGYPAAYPEVFAVSATNQQQAKAIFSNYGDYVDVAAPGENIPSTYIGNQYAALSGTSMASPHVAALAALIRSVNPKLRNHEVYEMMRQSAVDLGPEGKDDFYGYGQIHVQHALQMALGHTPNKKDGRPLDSPVEQEQVRTPSWLKKWLQLLFGTMVE